MKNAGKRNNDLITVALIEADIAVRFSEYIE